jgi:hypothetical protein
MRTVTYYKAVGILVLGTLSALATAGQNQGSNDAGRPSHQQGKGQMGRSASPQGGYHSSGNGDHFPHGSGGASPHSQMPHSGGYSPGRHSSFVTQSPHGGMRTEHRFAGGGRAVEATRSMPGGGAMHAVRYGRGLSGVVEHPLKPGYFSRTYVRGGRVVDSRVYGQHSFTRFGRTFTYQSFVPAVAFAPAYYAWAVRPWPTAVTYQWGWEKERWYAAYGDYFTPYSDYTSLDLWVTDYVISQNMRASYQNWQADTYTDTDSASGEAAQPGDAPSSASSESETPSASDPAATSDQTPPPQAAPPPITPEIKQQLNTQIKLKLREREKTTGESANDGPGALKPGHTLFRVNAPLDVPSDTPGRVCSLGPDDYIERTGEMDNNGNVPVEVKLSAISDCGTGLVTRVSENDLEAMDSEQDEQLTGAMLAASKKMGPKGLPKAPAATPLLVSAGQTPADANAPRTLNSL